MTAKCISTESPSDALMQHLADAVEAAGGTGVEFDHTSQWLDDDITAVAYIDAEPRRSGEPDYSRDHVYGKDAG